MLKPFYANETEIPEALREHYEKSEDGKWHVAVEGHRERVRVLNQENRSFRQRAEKAESDLSAAREHERKVIIESRLGIALARARVVPEHHDLLLEKLAQRVSIETVDGERVVKITDAKDFADLVAQATRQWPGAFFAPNLSGSGASTHTAAPGTKTMSRAEFNALDPATQMSRMQSGWGVQ